MMPTAQSSGSGAAERPRRTAAASLWRCPSKATRYERAGAHAGCRVLTYPAPSSRRFRLTFQTKAYISRRRTNTSGVRTPPASTVMSDGRTGPSPAVPVSGASHAHSRTNQVVELVHEEVVGLQTVSAAFFTARGTRHNAPRVRRTDCASASTSTWADGACSRLPPSPGPTAALGWQPAPAG